jgi:hypothetical protein
VEIREELHLDLRVKCRFLYVRFETKSACVDRF